MQGARVRALVRELDATTKTWHNQRNKYVKINNNRQRAVRRVGGHRSKSGEVWEAGGIGMLNADEKTRKDKGWDVLIGFCTQQVTSSFSQSGVRRLVGQKPDCTGLRCE